MNDIKIRSFEEKDKREIVDFLKLVSEKQGVKKKRVIERKHGNRNWLTNRVCRKY